MMLSKLQADPAEFRRTLLIDTDGQTVRFGETIDGWQAEDFAALDQTWRRARATATGSTSNSNVRSCPFHP